MATITRSNLIKAVTEVSPEFVSDEARHKLPAWAYTARSFKVGDWDKCPLDQIGLVDKFTTRSRYDGNENLRFVHEASEVDARILNYVDTHLRGELHEGLLVYVI